MTKGDKILRLGCEENDECKINAKAEDGRLIGLFLNKSINENTEKTVCCEDSNCNYQVF